jgi:hypothetical protein
MVAGMTPESADYLDQMEAKGEELAISANRAALI